jgi:hypothetical protein
MCRYWYFCLVGVSLLLANCTQQPAPPTAELRPVTLDETVQIVTGQTVYVPVYSHIYFNSRSQKINLAATLSLRNTDIDRPIIITSVNYYNTDGELIRSYLEQPIELAALASTDFVVEREDTSGGSGANFIVEWVAQTQVSEPIIEAVMINTMGNQGISFVSAGKVIKTQDSSN